jgi:Na+-transporting methylmalonyl-CoA/oxaloacetate decarboxylase gamma subunit
MDLHHMLALAGSSGFDDMLRLFGIAAILHVLFKGIQSLVARPAPSSPPAPKATSTPAEPDESISPEIIAVIAAAVACHTGQAQRVVSIKRQSSSWELVGRQSVLTSHRIR